MLGSVERGAPCALDSRALRACALGWLAQREYSRAELRRKLLTLALATPHADGRRGPASVADVDQSGAVPTTTDSPSAETASARVEATLEWLEAHHYLSQHRFIESRVRMRAQRFGNLRIRQELALHGVRLPPDVAAALNETEFERARAVWERKFAGHAPATPDKQARFLAARGFARETIRRVLRVTRLPDNASEIPGSVEGAYSEAGDAIPTEHARLKRMDKRGKGMQERD